MTVNLCFDPDAVKSAELLEQLLSFHGLNVFSSPLPTASVEANAPCVFALRRGSRRPATLRDRTAWTMIMDPAPDDGPPAGDLEFTRAGVAALVRGLRDADDHNRRALETDRRTWDLRRFRFGLWLQFSRASGSGKFDPFPLTSSKKERLRAALLPEIRKYGFPDSTAERALTRALDVIWDRFEDRFPSAVHVVDAVAEFIWRVDRPHMLDRRG